MLSVFLDCANEPPCCISTVVSGMVTMIEEIGNKSVSQVFSKVEDVLLTEFRMK